MTIASASTSEPVLPILDPLVEIEKLREQFASHDKPIAFLIGAGASAAVAGNDGKTLIPAVESLTESVAAQIRGLDAKFRDAFDAIESQIEASPRPAMTPRAVNVEEILSAIRVKIEAMAESDELQGLSRGELKSVEEMIRKAIAKAAFPLADRIPERMPHHSLARWIGRIERSCAVEIFTTNYDTLIERALEDHRIPVFDGFVGSREPFFSSNALTHETYAPGKNWTRLWKLHGSINWKLGKSSFVRTQESEDGELILPSNRKYEESRKQPYVAMLDRLSSLLTKREDTLLITVGYSFGDQHINEVLFESLDVLERMHIVSLQFEDPDPAHDLVKKALSYPNLVIYGPRKGVLGCQLKRWKLLDPVDGRTSDLLDIPFDSDFEPGDTELPLTGRFRLGDFNWLAKFLDQISGAA